MGSRHARRSGGSGSPLIGNCVSMVIGCGANMLIRDSAP